MPRPAGQKLAAHATPPGRRIQPARRIHHSPPRLKPSQELALASAAAPPLVGGAIPPQATRAVQKIRSSRNPGKCEYPETALPEDD